MKRILSIVLVLALAVPASAQVLIKKGTTSVKRYVMLVDATTGAPETGYTITNLDLQYTREGAAPAAKVDATALAATDSAWDDDKAIEIDATSSPGLYRVDWRDAAFATGVNRVYLVVSGAGIQPAIEEVHLVDFDPADGVRLGLTALPNAAAEAAGGLYTRGTGAGQVNQAANGRIDVDIQAINSQTTAADNLQDFADQGYDSASNLASADTVEWAGAATATNDIALLATLAKTTHITGFNDLDAAGVRTAVGLASANLDTQLADILTDTGTTLQGELDGIQADTEDIQSKIGAPVALDGGAATLGGMLTKLADDAGGVDFDSSLHSGWGLGQKLDGLGGLSRTIGGTGNTTTEIHLSQLTQGDDEINDQLLVILDVSEGEYHARWVEDWVNSTKLATVATMPFTPQNSVDRFWLLPVRQDVSGGSGLDAAGVRAAVGLASANLDTQLGDIPTVADFFSVDSGTNYAAAHANSVVKQIADNAGGASLTVQEIVDGILDEPKADHNLADSVGELFNDLGTTESFGDAMDAQGYTTVRAAKLDTIDTIVADTNELQTDWVNGGRLDTILDARASQTSVDEIPTVAEFEARTLVQANYFDPAADSVIVGSFGASAITRAAFAVDTGLQSVRSNTAQAGAANTITLDANASGTPNFYKGRLIYLTGGTGVGQVRLCVNYNGATKVARVFEPWTVTPDNTTTFSVLPMGQ